MKNFECEEKRQEPRMPDLPACLSVYIVQARKAERAEK